MSAFDITPQNRRFGIFEVDARARELRKNGSRVKLQQQPLELLLILLERPGEVVSREEIRRRLWPEGVYVDFDRSLNKAIVKLRDALGDQPEAPQYVETLPRIGYRFIGPTVVPTANGSGYVTPQVTVPDAATEQFVRSVNFIRGNVALRVAAALLLIVGVATAWMVQKRNRAFAPIHSLAVLPLDNLSGRIRNIFRTEPRTKSLQSWRGFQTCEWCHALP